jgi:predicted TIM-barrel fold metal-dependent hydrolase
MIDAHAHVFPAVNGRVAAGPTASLGHGRARVGNETLQVTPDYGETTCFTPAMWVAELDAADVELAVLLQGPFWGECNAYAADAVRCFPGRFVAQAYLDPWEEDWRARLETILATPEFRGIKIEFSMPTGLGGVHPGARLDDPDLEAAWALLERENRVLTLDLGSPGTASYQTDAVHKIATTHPALTIVICHLGQPGPALNADAALQLLWQEQIVLGTLPNVHFDTASLPAYFRDQNDPYPSCRDVIHRAVETVGPEKIIWGSDGPGNFTLCRYSRFVELAKVHTDFLSPAEQQLLFSDNARRVYL